MTTKITKFSDKKPITIDVPPPLILTIEYLSQSSIQFKSNRPTNPIELGGLCTQIATQQFNVIAQQAINVSRPDRYAKHAFDGDNPARGCGICGRRADDIEIHDEPHATDTVSTIDYDELKGDVS